MPDPAQPVPVPLLPPLRSVKGRGTAEQPRHRFNAFRRETHDDGWCDTPLEDDDAPRLPTEVTFETARSILTRNSSPDIPFSLSLNPYRGCEHGCIYCYARPTHAYLDLSPGLDFETRIVAKRNAGALLRRELSRPGHSVSPIAIGTVTDAYQPVERRLRITREVLEILVGCGHPFVIITKSAGIERDLDLLVPAAAVGLCQVSISVTTLDPALARILEPRAASPSRRLQAVRRLRDAGVPVDVNVAPIIPFINDAEIERIVAAAADAGAQAAHYTILRLPLEVAALFEHWLRANFPERADRVLARVRELHGIGQPSHPGSDGPAPVYSAAFGQRMRGTGPWADLIRQRVARASRAAGMDQRLLDRLAVDRFVAPEAQRSGRRPDDERQGELF